MIEIKLEEFDFAALAKLIQTSNSEFRSRAMEMMRHTHKGPERFCGRCGQYLTHWSHVEAGPND